MKSNLRLHYSFFVFANFRLARENLMVRTAIDLERVFETAGISPTALERFANVEVYGDIPSEVMLLKRTFENEVIHTLFSK